MTPEQFAYWLQGFAELQGAVPTQEQWDSIREHLATVFYKITPPVAPPKRSIDIESSVEELIKQQEVSQPVRTGWPPTNMPGVFPLNPLDQFKSPTPGGKVVITC